MPLLAALVLLSPPTSSERRAILDAVRPVVESALRGQRVRFVVRNAAVERGWAFLDAKPVRPDGGRVDLQRSDFAAAAKEGMAGDGVVALLRRDGRRWRVVERALFPTDVAWEPWAAKTGAPRSIFPNGARKG